MLSANRPILGGSVAELEQENGDWVHSDDLKIDHNGESELFCPIQSPH